jgi:hypothetical protein
LTNVDPSDTDHEKKKLPGGIGPDDLLANVKNSTDGPTMIAKESWINLPVGDNLNDHVGVSVQRTTRFRLSHFSPSIMADGSTSVTD